jgi:ribosomal protein S18 acetylase RimI-like enzyme
MNASDLSVSLSPATREDIPFLLELRRLTMTEHLRASGVEPSEQGERERVLYRFECAQIVRRGAERVGLLKLARDEGRWQVIQIQIAPQLHGQGLGKELLSAVIAEAKQARVPLVLNVLHANPARRLYERLGFRVVKEGEHEYEMQLLAGEQ